MEADVISATLAMLLCCSPLPETTPDPVSAPSAIIAAAYHPGTGDGGVINTRTLQYHPGVGAHDVVNPYTGEYYVGDGAGGAIGFTLN